MAGREGEGVEECWLRSEPSLYSKVWPERLGLAGGGRRSPSAVLSGASVMSDIERGVVFGGGGEEVFGEGGGEVSVGVEEDLVRCSILCARACWTACFQVSLLRGAMVVASSV